MHACWRPPSKLSYICLVIILGLLQCKFTCMHDIAVLRARGHDRSRSYQYNIYNSVVRIRAYVHKFRHSNIATNHMYKVEWLHWARTELKCHDFNLNDHSSVDVISCNCLKSIKRTKHRNRFVKITIKKVLPQIPQSIQIVIIRRSFVCTFNINSFKTVFRIILKWSASVPCMDSCHRLNDSHFEVIMPLLAVRK